MKKIYDKLILMFLRPKKLKTIFIKLYFFTFLNKIINKLLSFEKQNEFDEKFLKFNIEFAR
jgi:hypothetical protein